MSRVLVIALLAALLPAVAFAQSMEIAGVVMTSRGVPIPGCIVLLLNPGVGASYPVSTGASGEYFFPNVPSRVSSLYTIQVRWRNNVIFNGLVRQPGMQPPIVITVP